MFVCNVGASAPVCSDAGLTKPDLRLIANLRDVRCLVNVPTGCAPGADYNPDAGQGPYTSMCSTAQSCASSGRAQPYCAESGTSQSDCLANADLTEVARLPGGSPGQGIRMTDRYNGYANELAATVADSGFPVPMDCLPTTDATIGSTCGVNTSANALVPGAIIDGSNAIWQLGEIQVLDSGPDGVRGNSDDQPVAVQGIYLP
jgi:hypothetical protein